MSIYCATFSDSSYRIQRWKKWKGAQVGWVDAPGLFHTDIPDWDISTHAIMFQAHHWRSIIKGLRTIGKEARLLLPKDLVNVDHQYWVSKKRQHHQFITFNKPAYRAMAEKSAHVHKVAIYQVRQVAPPGNRTLLFDNKIQTQWTCSRLAEKLEASGAIIGKAPNVTQDYIEEAIGVAAMVGGFFIS